MKIIKNIRLYDFKQYIKSGFIAFEEQIIKVGHMTDLDDFIAHLHENADVIDGKGQMVLPGLLLGHAHIYSTFARGWITPYNPNSFQDILDQLWWKLDSKLGEKEIYYSSYISGYEYLKHGITTVIDHHASGEMINGSLNVLKKGLVDDMGLRGVFCFETSDRFDVQKSIEENVNFYQKMKTKNSSDARGLLGMHASFSLNDNSFKLLSETPKEMPIHIHVAESIEDVEWTRKNCNISVIERLNKYELLRENSIYAHGVHLKEEEFQLIKDTKGIMAFNPSSNMNNGVGLPPVDLAIKYEIPWIIGNDGLGFGMSRDLQNIIFTNDLKGPNHFKLDQLLNSILYGYEYVSKLFNCKIGELSKGFESDFILLQYDEITEMKSENAFGHFVYGMLENMQPSEVYVKGIQRISDYRCIDDIEEDLKSAKECACRLWEKLN